MMLASTRGRNLKQRHLKAARDGRDSHGLEKLLTRARIEKLVWLVYDIYIIPTVPAVSLDRPFALRWSMQCFHPCIWQVLISDLFGKQSLSIYRLQCGQIGTCCGHPR